MSGEVLERSVIHKGKVFIKAGEENIRAYVLQSGKVCSFVTNDEGEHVEVERHGPGIIIGEMSLIQDETPTVSYKALTDSTVITITRQDFEKKMHRIDSTVKKIFKYLVHKLDFIESEAVKGIEKEDKVDERAYKILQSMTSKMAPEKQKLYEEKLMAHINGLVKGLDELQSQGRHEQQQKDLEQKIGSLK